MKYTVSKSNLIRDETDYFVEKFIRKKEYSMYSYCYAFQYKETELFNNIISTVN